MSIYNDIVRRTHLPREHAIRRIMAGTGIDLSLYGPSSHEELPVEEEEPLEGLGMEEAGESEVASDEDPCT